MASSDELAKLFVSIGVDSTEFDNKMTSLNKKIDDVGDTAETNSGKINKFGGLFKGMAGAIGATTIAAGAFAIKLGKDVVQSFSELEQNIGGAEAVFGEFADAIQKTGQEAYKNLGVSQSQYLATANKMGALFQGSGITQERSLDLTTNAMQRAADMASVMGIDMQVALDSVAGAAKGNFTMMDNLGVAMNATNVEAYALSKGMTDFSFATATGAEKAEMAMQMFLENTTQYAGNFAKESTETISGSIGMLKGALGSFIAGLGDANADMTVLTGNVINAFQSVITNIKPIIENIIKALPAAIDTILLAMVDLLPMILTTFTDLFSKVLTTLLTLLPEIIPVVIDALLTIVDTVIENLPLIINAAIAILLALVQGIAESLPTLIPAVIEALLTIVTTLLDNIDLIIDAAILLMMGLMDGMITALPILINKLPEIIDKLIQAVVNNLPKLIQMIIDLNIALAKAMIKAVPQLLSKLPQIITSIVKGLGVLVEKMWDLGKNIVSGIWNGIKNAGSWLFDKIKGFAGDVLDKFKGLFKIGSPSKLFADTIGKNIPLGIEVGIDEEKPSLFKNIKGMVDKVKMGMDSEFQGVFNTNAMVPAYARVSVNSPKIPERDNTYTFEVTTNLDGRKVAKTIVRYTDEELRALQRNRG